MRDNSTRANHGREKTKVLATWFRLHAEHPYPTEAEKVALEEAAGMNRRQLNNWFVNGESLVGRVNNMDDRRSCR